MSRVPRGIPALTYLKIFEPVGLVGDSCGDILVDGNSISVLETGHPSSRYEVAQVLNSKISDEDICEMITGNSCGGGVGSSLNPIAAFVNDSVTCVLFIIGSKKSKKWQFLKKTFLPFVANELFANIGDKNDELLSSYYSARLTLSAFEIQDEFLTDLLRPGNRGLFPSLSAEDGMAVQGIHKELFTNEVGLRRMFADACENRASHVLPVGGGIDTSSAVFEITLQQSEGGPNPNSLDAIQTCTSRLLIVDIPCTDPLAGGVERSTIQQLRGFEQPTLHKSLSVFYDVMKSLSVADNNHSKAQFRSSLLTQFLTELLGGNAIVVALGFLSHFEPSVSKKTLEIISCLNKAMHYPIGGKELSDVLLGLLTKYRSMVLQVEDALMSKNVANKTEIDEERAVEKQVIELQKNLAEALVEKNQAFEDREHLFEMVELLKAKYTTLMDEKLQQSKQLAALEEDKIELAKELMQCKLETTEVSEQHELEVSDASKENIALKDEVLSLNSRYEKSMENVEELKTRLRTLEDAIDLMAKNELKKNETIERYTNELAKANEKNVDLGAELLTLLNSRAVLEEKIKKLESDNEKMSNIGVKLDKNEKDSTLEVSFLIDEMRKKDKELMELKVILKNQEVVIEKHDDIHDDVSSFENKNTTKAKDKKNNDMLLAIKKYDRMVRDYEKKLSRMRGDMDATNIEKQQLQTTFDETFQKYHDAVFPKPKTINDVKNEEKSKLFSSFANDKTSTINASVLLQNKLFESYNDREKFLKNRIQDVVSKKNEMLSVLREMSDEFSLVLDFLDDVSLYNNDSDFIDVDSDFSGVLKQKIESGQQLLTKSEHFLNAAKTTSLQQHDIENNNKQQEDEAVDDNERSRMALIVATFQKHLQVAENKVTTLERENIELHIKIKQLLNDGKSQWALMESNKKFTMNNNNNNNTSIFKNGDFEDDIHDEKKNVSALASNNNDNNNKSPISVACVTNDNDNGSTTQNHVANLQTEHDGHATTTTNKQLKNLEARAAQLGVKNASLEEELLSYQTYMRHAIPQYKKQIQRLQAQLEYFSTTTKKNNGKKNVVDDEVDERFNNNNKALSNKALLKSATDPKFLNSKDDFSSACLILPNIAKKI